jgi:hypothetical protein
MDWRRLALSLVIIFTLTTPALGQDDSDPPSDQPPAPPAATPAPQPTPAPTTQAGPPAPGTVLFSDNFDDPAAGRLTRTSADPARYERGYTEGEYVLAKTDPQWDGAPTVGLPGRYDNAAFAVDARVLGSPTGTAIRLYCRIQDGSAFNAYGMSLLPTEGALRIYRYDDNRATPLTEWQESTAIRRGNEMNRIEFVCAGTVISATINGTQVALTSDGTYREGRASIQAGTTTASGTLVHGRFDNLVVTQRGEEAPPPPGRYDGGWTGSTNDGRANSFTVRNDAVVSLNIDALLDAGSCTIRGLRTVIPSSPARIENGAFTVNATQDVTVRSVTPGDSTTWPGTLTFNVSGRFASDTSASGEAEVHIGVPAMPCSGSTRATWRATKN